VTIFDQKIVTKDTFSHLRQVEKWGFSTNASWVKWGTIANEDNIYRIELGRVGLREEQQKLKREHL
jgi:hypothetical protein